MIFKRVVIDNFFSVRDRLTWELENQGAVLVRGENLDSTSASSNGAGKSTLFEALVWCLWGKTTRGQWGESVINRQAKKDCKVSVRLLHAGREYEVCRCRSGNGRGTLEFIRVDLHDGVEIGTDLTQGTATLTQTRIDTFLGIDYQTFIQGPMMPQGAVKKFSAMTDGEQKQVLEQSLQLGILAEAATETKERFNAAKFKLTEAAQSLFQLEDHHRELQELKAQYKEEQAAWQAKKTKSLALALRREQLVEELEQEALWERGTPIKCPFFLDQAREEIRAMERSKEKLQKEANQDWKDYQKLMVEAKSDLKQWKAEMARLETQVRSVQRLEGSCPTCYQDVSTQHVKACTTKLKGDFGDAALQVEKARKSIARIDKLSMESQREYSIILEKRITKINQAEDDRRNLEKEVQESKQWIEELKNSLGRERQAYERYVEKQREESPYENLLADVDRKLIDSEKRLCNRKSVVQRWKLEMDHLEFWKTGFSNQGLKSYIMQSVTPFLNERANHYAQILTGGEISIEFNTQTTLKSGETRERFSVLVENRNGAETYAGNSGGEKSRADIAINFALSDLMSARAQRPYPQRFLDEPFENLDESGIESVVGLLADMAKNANSVFVITHLDSMKGLFKNTLNLVKKDGCTKLML